jgi:hypothetical protein
MVKDDEFNELRDRVKRIEDILFSDKNNVPVLSQKRIKKSASILFEDLKSQGFFDEPRSIKDIVSKLSESGYHYASTSLTETLQRSVRKGFLGRIKKDKKWVYVKR